MIYDPEYNYCPKCQDEYRADIRECAACGVALVPGAEMSKQAGKADEQRDKRKGDLKPGDDIVNIHKGSLADLKPLEKELEAEYIGYLIAGDDQGGCNKGCCASSFYLKVRREDAREAFMIIDRQFEIATGINDHDLSLTDSVYNPDAGQAVCPACGFTFKTSDLTCPDCGLCFG